MVETEILQANQEAESTTVTSGLVEAIPAIPPTENTTALTPLNFPKAVSDVLNEYLSSQSLLLLTFCGTLTLLFSISLLIAVCYLAVVRGRRSRRQIREAIQRDELLREAERAAALQSSWELNNLREFHLWRERQLGDRQNTWPTQTNNLNSPQVPRAPPGPQPTPRQ